MSLKITPSVTVAYTTQKRDITLKDTRVIEGIRYFHLSKKQDSKVCQLLSIPRLVGNERALSKTDIIEQLLALRKEHYESWYLAQQEPNRAAVFDIFESIISRNKPRRKKKTVLMHRPATTEIKAPEIGGVEGVGIKILTGSGSKRLYVELSWGVLAYLSKVCAWQIENAGIKRVRVKGQEGRRVRRECEPSDAIDLTLEEDSEPATVAPSSPTAATSAQFTTPSPRARVHESTPANIPAGVAAPARLSLRSRMGKWLKQA